MESTGDAQLVGQLASKDDPVAHEAARSIFAAGTRMIGPLLLMEGRTEPYGGRLGHPRGSTPVVIKVPGYPLTPELEARVVTVQAAALYLIEAIYAGAIDFASSPLLMDLRVPPDERDAANTAVRLAAGFASARAWWTACQREGIEAMRAGGKRPLDAAELAFW